MLTEVVFQALKSLLFFFMNVWRRALCCFRRRRRMSCESVPLVGVVSGYPGPSCSTSNNELENWNWDDTNTNNFKPNSVQEHIEFYRQQKQRINSQTSESDEEIQQDFFQDMTPRITKQTKVFIDDENNEHHKTNSSKYSLAPQPLVVSEGELGEWEENTGWEEQTNPDWDPQMVLREKRRQERERRIWEQQQKRQEKVMRPLSLGAKIS